ncbi:MAG: histidine kinase [Prolixibacteraceae bacterium]|nr:histidine kinase [Prolixibacteraceae bacterium]
MTFVKHLGSFFSWKSGCWVLQIGGWLLMLLLDYFQSYQEINNEPAPYIWLLSVFTGFCITLMLRKFYQQFCSRKKSVYFYFFLIVVSSLVAGFLWYLVRFTLLTPWHRCIAGGDGFHIELLSPYKIIILSLDYTWIFFIWSALYLGLKFWIDLIEAKERGEKALLLAQKSQLLMLRYQLNPHFLFNALNSIQALIYENPNHADEMITELSEFLRFTIKDKDKLFIPLGKEVEIVKKYLSIEKTRFPDRLEYLVNVSSHAFNQEVIAFILQPFVENAVKYGMKTSKEKLSIVIDGYTENDKLFLKITNSGHWVDNAEESGTGIQNVFDRLNNAYPGKYQLNILKNSDSVCVIIEISI